MMPSFIHIALIEVLVIALATFGHYWYIENRGAIHRREKGPLAALEYVAILLILGSSVIETVSGALPGNADRIFWASLVLFPGLRWQRDYLLNYLRGLEWEYVPEFNSPTTSFTDKLLSLLDTPEAVNAVRLIGLWICVIASLIIYTR